MSSDINLFQLATRQKFRFASNAGHLTVEDLWDLPLTSRTGRASLNSIAIELNTQFRALAEESFVETSTSPERDLLANRLELVKAIIAVRQAEAKANTERAATESLKARLREAIQAKKDEQINATPLEELQAQLAALEAG